MSINSIIDQLKNYNGPNELTLHKGATEAIINQAERSYNIILPDDFKVFYRFTDGFEIDEDIFNIIPLKEIAENSKNDKGIFYFAGIYDLQRHVGARCES